MEERYTVVEQKGKSTFRSIRRADQKTVMLKKVTFCNISAKEKQQIVNEVNTLIKVDYIHIVRYLEYQINKKDITVDIAMEYCQGGNLQSYLQKLKQQGKRVTEDEAWRIFYQLTQALDCIHQDSIIHRNINPSKVYFKDSLRKNIKLGGFSLAKKLQAEEKFSSTWISDTFYLSPEQIDTGLCTRQTDLWALGCLLYQVCSLQSPFVSSNDFQRARLVKQSRPKKLPYSIQLNRVIFWCLEKNPEDRPLLSDLLGTPQINIRIRQRRYQQKYTEYTSKEERLRQKQKELNQREAEILRQQRNKGSSYQSIKKRADFPSARMHNQYQTGPIRALY